MIRSRLGAKPGSWNILALATSLLAACAVGPNFKSPPPPEAKTYTNEPLADSTDSADAPFGAAQRFADGKDLPERWWALFGSDALNRLMDDAVAKNPDLAAARASLAQAHEAALAAEGSFFPHIDAQGGATREKISPAAFGIAGAPSSIFTLYNASVSVSYGFDLFGLTRRQVEESLALAEAQEDELAAAYITLTANVATAAIAEASLRAQIHETETIAEEQADELKVLNTQFELGGISKAPVLEQEAALGQTRASLPPLTKQLAHERHLLATLTGRLPADKPDDAIELAQLTLPEELPISVPSKLVERRPDLRAADAQLHAASAAIGVATANMFPQISLSANYGTETTTLGNSFTPGAEVWSLGANLLQPIFRGGTLLHEKRAAVAAYDKARAQYQSAVLAAFASVADALRAVEADAQGLRAQAEAEAAAQKSLDLIHSQFKDGAVSYLQLLDAERTYQQTRVALAQAQGLRLSDTVALFQALGGWWPENLASTAPSSKPLATAEKTP